MAEPEEKEAEILREFLPEQLGEAEISKIVEEVIAGMDDVSIQKMGQVIGAVKVKSAMLRMARWWQKLLKKNSQNRRKNDCIFWAGGCW